MKSWRVADAAHAAQAPLADTGVVFPALAQSRVYADQGLTLDRFAVSTDGTRVYAPTTDGVAAIDTASFVAPQLFPPFSFSLWCHPMSCFPVDSSSCSSPKPCRVSSRASSTTAPTFVVVPTSAAAVLSHLSRLFCLCSKWCRSATVRSWSTTATHATLTRLTMSCVPTQSPHSSAKTAAAAAACWLTRLRLHRLQPTRRSSLATRAWTKRTTVVTATARTKSGIDFGCQEIKRRCPWVSGWRRRFFAKTCCWVTGQVGERKETATRTPQQQHGLSHVPRRMRLRRTGGVMPATVVIAVLSPLTQNVGAALGAKSIVP